MLAGSARYSAGGCVHATAPPPVGIEEVFRTAIISAGQVAAAARFEGNATDVGAGVPPPGVGELGQ